MKTKTHLQSVKDHLTKKKTLSSWEAIEKYRITRLAEFIRSLRHDHGWNIESVWKEKNGKRWVVYTLIK